MELIEFVCEKVSSEKSLQLHTFRQLQIQFGQLVANLVRQAGHVHICIRHVSGLRVGVALVGGVDLAGSNVAALVRCGLLVHCYPNALRTRDTKRMCVHFTLTARCCVCVLNVHTSATSGRRRRSTRRISIEQQQLAAPRYALNEFRTFSDVGTTVSMMMMMYC